MLFLVLRKAQQNYKKWKYLVIAKEVPTLILDKEVYDFLFEWKHLSQMTNFTENLSWEELNVFIMLFLKGL